MPRRGPGRHRGRRWIERLPATDYYYPKTVTPGGEGVSRVTVEELEALRLVDLLGLTQEEAAFRMGVSRKTFWRDLTSARRKIAEALINGWAIQIIGGDYILRGERSEVGGE